MSATSSAPAPKDRELQIDDDLSFQRWSWRMERFGWAVFVVLILAAVLGLFGSGVLSGTAAGSAAEGVWVEYQRLTRLKAPTELVVHVDRRRVQGDQVHLILGGAYLREAQLQSLIPRTSSGGASQDKAVLSFDARGDTGLMQFVLQIQFNRPGLAEGQIGLQGGPVLKTRHWVYP